MRVRTIALAACCAAGATACARNFRPEAFRNGTTVAVVGVSTAPRVDYVRQYAAMGFNGYMDTRAEIVEIGPASAVLPETTRAVMRVLAGAKSFRLVPEERVVGTAAYAAVPASPTNFFTKDLLTARGYKGLYTADALAVAARRLGVSGALAVGLTHHVGPGDRGVVGRVTVQVAIVDRAGQYIWSDYTRVDSERAVPDVRKGSIEAVRPLLVESAERGARELLARLRDRLASTS